MYHSKNKTQNIWKETKTILSWQPTWQCEMEISKRGFTWFL